MSEQMKHISTISDWGKSLDPNLRIASNQNPLYDNYLKLSFDRIPNVSYSCQSVTLPSLNVGVATQPTRFGLPYHHPGTSAMYSDLQVRFIVDEDLKNYREIIAWMRSIVPVADFREINSNPATHISDATLFLLNSARRPNLRVTIKDCFPILVDDLALSTDISEPAPIIVTATFKINDILFENV